MMGNQQYIPEPKTEEHRRIYESQVLIPITVSGKNHAFFGPLPNLNIEPRRLRNFFPTYHKRKPIGQAKRLRAEKTATAEESQPLADETIDLRFMNNGFRVFRVTPSFKDPTDYLNWLNKIEKTKSQTWKDMGIYDLIMLSKVKLDYSSTLLVSSLYFWDITHYTFHLPYGMVTPTLFDIAAITGLKLTGNTYDPNIESDDSIAFTTSRAAYSTHITHYHGKDTDTISDVEHIAFLALWLSHCIFCSKSLQVAKKYITLANQLHFGHDVCLSEMIMASLYESLSDGVT